ncbi:hypothetical protein SLA2020_218520 [Shorea laevis]
MSSATLSQGSFSVIQVGSMDRHITPNFEIPAGSFSVFQLVSLVARVFLYDQILLPVASKIKGKPVRRSFKQRMGIGLIFTSVSMAAVAIVESIYRRIALEQGFSDDSQAIVHLSAIWLLPYHFLGGLSVAFVAIGQTTFFYSELPKTMSSIASNLFILGMAAAMIASFITSTVDDITKRLGGESWVSSNINKGHYDYYYWFLAGLGLLNFIYFLACSKAYGPCKEDEGEISPEGDDI